MSALQFGLTDATSDAALKFQGSLSCLRKFRATAHESAVPASVGTATFCLDERRLRPFNLLPC